MGKRILPVMIFLTVISFMFPMLWRVTGPVMLLCIALMCCDAVWLLFKLIFFKGKFDGNQTSR